MKAKNLTIASAIVLVMGLAFGQAIAQTGNDAAPPAATAPATPDAGAAPAPDATGAPGEAMPGAAAPGEVPMPGAEAPAAAPPPAAPAPETTEAENPYGLGALWEKGD